MIWTFNHRVALVAGSLLTFFLLLFGGVSYFKVKFYVEKEIVSKQMGLMKALQIDINGWIQPSIRQVNDLAKELESNTPFEKEKIVPILLRSKKAINAIQVYFGLEDGRMMYDTGKELSQEWYDPRNRPWYMEGLEANETILSEPFVGFASNQLTVTIMSPVWVEGMKKGVVAASFYVNKLYRKIKAIPLEEGYAFVVDAKGKIIIHPDKSMINVNLQEQNSASKKLYEQMRTSHEGVYLYTFEDTKELMTFGKLHNGWFSVVSVKYAQAYAFVDTLLKLFWIMGVLMIALTIMVLVKMTQKSFTCKN